MAQRIPSMIYYRDGYKYQLTSDYSVWTSIVQASKIDTQFITLESNGWITIKSGYAWDGPSGPTIDTKNFMRGSLVHDALYQLMRDQLLDPKTWRDPADRELQKICIEDGMSTLRAWWVYEGVRLGGGAAVQTPNPVLTAP